VKPRLLDYLVCPKDQTELKMVAWKFRPIFLSQAHRKLAQDMRFEAEKISKDVFEGVLVNHERKIVYPIIDGIPRLLLFATQATRAFFAKNKARLAQELPFYELPSFQVLEHERRAGHAFENQIFAAELELNAKEKAEKELLKRSLGEMLDVSRKPLCGHSVLDVGLGLGAIASDFAQEQQCELIGMDASHLVDTVHKSATNYPFFHLVQASIMAPVFRPRSFDLTYSVGALNRFYAPKLGIAKMSELPKRLGRLSVWFDDDTSESLSRSQKFMTATERWLRPMISHLPRRVRAYAVLSCMPLYLMHQRLFAEQYADAGLLQDIKGAMAVAEQRLEWQLNQGLSDQDVHAWFAEHGYASLQLRKKGDQSSRIRSALWNCAGVEGVRA
jgi:uncharacterized protein YbaR (Trm112 family)/ubiquinone/menaquinone biosynthesis C-methylase UbiE